MQVLAGRILLFWQMRYIIDLFLQPVRKTYYKSTTSNKYVLGIRKETRASLNLAIMSKSQEHMI